MAPRTPNPGSRVVSRVIGVGVGVVVVVEDSDDVVEAVGDTVYVTLNVVVMTVGKVVSRFRVREDVVTVVVSVVRERDKLGVAVDEEELVWASRVVTEAATAIRKERNRIAEQAAS